MQKKVTPADIDWTAVADRFLTLKNILGLNSEEISKKYQIELALLSKIESGEQNKFRDCTMICEKLSISSKWFLLGKGESKRVNLKVNKGAGIRKSQFRKSVEDGEIADEALEFMLALDQFKRKNNKRFLTTTETYQVIKFLGYRKTAAQATNINDMEDCLS